jgi:hypothetical protein
MADDPQREVLSSLPRTRPARRSAKRSGGAAGEQAADAVKAAASDGSADTSSTSSTTTAASRGGRAKVPRVAESRPSPDGGSGGTIATRSPVGSQGRVGSAEP